MVEGFWKYFFFFVTNWGVGKIVELLICGFVNLMLRRLPKASGMMSWDDAAHGGSTI